MNKRLICVTVFIFLALQLASAYRRVSLDSYSHGPLETKTMYIPYLGHLVLPGVSPDVVDERFTFKWRYAITFVNDFFPTDYSIDSNDRENDLFAGRDYESINSEFGFYFSITKRLTVSAHFRIIDYYGGFLDSIVEGFHHTFGFPNGAREFFPRNKVYVNIPNTNNVPLYLDRPAIAMGDIDLWVKYTALSHRFVSIAVMGGVKLPTGRPETLSGSGYADFGAGVLMALHPVKMLTVHLQGGLILPVNVFKKKGNGRELPMINGIFALEFHPVRQFSLLAQFNIKSSPLKADYVNYKPALGTEFNYYQSPQTNLLIGIIIHFLWFDFQGYFEEDTFTNSGADITIGFALATTMRLKRPRAFRKL